MANFGTRIPEDRSSREKYKFQMLGSSTVLAVSPVSADETYDGEQLRPSNIGTKVTCTTADKVYGIDVNSGTAGAIRDGTNKIGYSELVVFKNNYADPTGTGSATLVRVYRDSIADGSTPDAGNLVDEFMLFQQSRVRIPTANNWSTASIMIASADAAVTFNLDVKLLYYTPSTG